jgi:hypothetical protein
MLNGVSPAHILTTIIEAYSLGETLVDIFLAKQRSLRWRAGCHHRAYEVDMNAAIGYERRKLKAAI